MLLCVYLEMWFSLQSLENGKKCIIYNATTLEEAIDKGRKEFSNDIFVFCSLNDGIKHDSQWVQNACQQLCRITGACSWACRNHHKVFCNRMTLWCMGCFTVVWRRRNVLSNNNQDQREWCLGKTPSCGVPQSRMQKSWNHGAVASQSHAGLWATLWWQLTIPRLGPCSGRLTING